MDFQIDAAQGVDLAAAAAVGLADVLEGNHGLRRRKGRKVEGRNFILANGPW
ncbi:hypothetical protein [Pseudoxanthomonas sp. SORGH_AS_0997]|uniref:hypothetical protein n=1 Tax=Pseudoxanthomonas sp. SORGH_AS_0997 TaxID=3041776 RepID=UPI00285E710B|nr:hypothetical protein [Pseudoxanthomonas sp. SORGH_AS_0997]MDR6139610.1 hypothetical protein [Pseudoxanthomonas sp. SORGH_AS_0997]